MDSCRPSLFQKRHFAAEIIVTSVRWYLRFALSLRDIERTRTRRKKPDGLLTGGWADLFGSPRVLEGHCTVNTAYVNCKGERTSFGCPNSRRKRAVNARRPLSLQHPSSWPPLDSLAPKSHAYLSGAEDHACRNQIPSPATAGGTGPSHQGLARVLAGRLGPTPGLLSGDAGAVES